jgi:hypothetical protein
MEAVMDTQDDCRDKHAIQALEFEDLAARAFPKDHEISVSDLREYVRRQRLKESWPKGVAIQAHLSSGCRICADRLSVLEASESVLTEQDAHKVRVLIRADRRAEEEIGDKAKAQLTATVGSVGAAVATVMGWLLTSKPRV